MCRSAFHLALICVFSLCFLSIATCSSFRSDDEKPPNKTSPTLDTQFQTSGSNRQNETVDGDGGNGLSATDGPKLRTNGNTTGELPALVCLELVQTCPSCQLNESGTRCFVRGGIKVMLIVIVILVVIGLFCCICFYKTLMKEVHKLSKTLKSVFGNTAQNNDTLSQEKQGFVPA